MHPATLVGRISHMQWYPWSVHNGSHHRALGGRLEGAGLFEYAKELGVVDENSEDGLHGHVDRVGKAGLHEHVDGDFAGCLDTRRSNPGFMFKLYRAASSWCSRKQQSTALSALGSEFCR
jgi:hypothetical protein